MKKNHRKTENKIVKALSSVCDALMFDTEGFCWLTHFVDYDNVPQSLRIVCVFDKDLALVKARSNGLPRSIQDLAEIHLEKVGIVVPHIEKAVFFDTEENGADVNAASWCRKYSKKE